MSLGRSQGDRELEMIWTDHSCMKPGKFSNIKQTLKSLGRNCDYTYEMF